MAVATKSLRLASYTRVSDEGGRSTMQRATDEEGGDFFSRVEQRETNQRFADARPDVEIDRLVEAIDVSSKGGNNFRQPEFLELVEAIKRGEIDGVLVPRFDRFGRDLKECLVMIDLIEDAGGVVISASETTAQDAAGKLARNAFLMFANYQLDRITENWIKVHDRMHQKGITHGRIPLGYVKGAAGRLCPHETYGPLITWAFEQRAAGVPVSELARQLIAKGLPIGDHQTLRGILKRRTYLGEIKRGKRPAIVDAHPALTTPIIFEAVQARWGQRAGWSKGDYLGTGLVRCGSCGWSMAYDRSGSPTYGCGNDLSCPRKAAIAAAKLEEFIETEFWKHLDDVLFQAALITPDLTDLEAALLTAKDDLRMWNQNTAAQRLDMGLWQEEADRRAGIIEATDQALRAARAKVGLSDSGVPAGMTLRQVYDNGDNTVKREILSRGIESVTVKPSGRGAGRYVPAAERLTIHWK